MGFPRQEYWSKLLFPSLRDLPDSGVKPESPKSPALQKDSLPLCHLGNPAHQCGTNKAVWDNAKLHVDIGEGTVFSVSLSSLQTEDF